MSAANEVSLVQVREGHFPRWLSNRCRNYIRKYGDDVGVPPIAGLQHVDLLGRVLRISLLRQTTLGVWLRQGQPADSDHFSSMFDHWGSIQGGKAWVTEPYMYPPMWPKFEALADSLDLQLDFTDDSTHNPKPKRIGPQTRYCSRVAFRPKEELPCH